MNFVMGILTSVGSFSDSKHFKADESQRIKADNTKQNKSELKKKEEKEEKEEEDKDCDRDFIAEITRNSELLI